MAKTAQTRRHGCWTRDHDPSTVRSLTNPGIFMPLSVCGKGSQYDSTVDLHRDLAAFRCSKRAMAIQPMKSRSNRLPPSPPIVTGAFCHAIFAEQWMGAASARG